MAKINAGSAVVNVLKNWDVDHVYGLPGDSIDHIVDALQKEQEAIKFIHVRHEEVASLSAAAYTKLTGKIGVALSIGGPGAIHLLNGMYDAKMDKVPQLVLVGQIPSDLANSDYFQEVNTSAIFEDVAVFNKEITRPEQLPLIVDQAIRTAYEKRGVAVVIIPDDIPANKIVDTVERVKEAKKPTQVGLNTPDLEAAVALINESKKPVMLIGTGTKKAKAEVLAFSERFDIPVMSTLPGKGIMPDEHSNYLGNIGKIGTKPAFEAMQEADLLLMVGNDYPYGTYLPKDVKCIQIEIEPSRMGKRHDVTVGIVGDSKEALAYLTAHGEEVTNRPFLQACTKNMQTWWKWMEEHMARDTSPIAPQAVIKQMQRIADEDAVFSIDVGTSTVWSTRYLKLGQKNDFLVSAWLGTMGCALPGAIASKIAYPNRQVISLQGDGAFSMVMQDFATAVYYDLPIINVVLSNKQLSFIKYEQQAQGQLNYGIDHGDINFAKYAEACGGKGYRVENTADLEAVFTAAKADNCPVIIDVVVDPEAAPLPGKIVMDEAKGFAKFEIRTALEEKRIASMPPLKDVMRQFF